MELSGRPARGWSRPAPPPPPADAAPTLAPNQPASTAAAPAASAPLNGPASGSIDPFSAADAAADAAAAGPAYADDEDSSLTPADVLAEADALAPPPPLASAGSVGAALPPMGKTGLSTFATAMDAAAAAAAGIEEEADACDPCMDKSLLEVGGSGDSWVAQLKGPSTPVTMRRALLRCNLWHGRCVVCRCRWRRRCRWCG